ncbi:PD-(D/E)XK nuclease-like domain-containing protein [Shewanella oncorhynchi]|uniref:PD-(D/E)XK nuclease-like domain-containing protein n=1 Tax=Shewanella oncorhynchi TaxID=2726434 RepID=UPI003D7A7BD1
MSAFDFDLDALNSAMDAFFDLNSISTVTITSQQITSVIPACLSHLVKPGYVDGKAQFLSDSGELIEGVFSDIPNDVYHSLIAISSSQVKCYADSPMKYEQAYINGKGKQFSAKSRESGVLSHELTLEGADVFNARRFALLDPEQFPDDPKSLTELKESCSINNLPTSGTIAELIKRLEQNNAPQKAFESRQLEWIKTNIGDECFDLCEAALQSVVTCAAIIKLLQENQQIAIKAEKLPVSKEMFDDVIALNLAIERNTHANKFLNRKNGMAEVAFFSKDPDTGLMLKCKVDWLTAIKKSIVPCDLKTSRSANPALAAYQFADLRYDLQAVFYLKVIKPHLKAAEYAERLFPLITVETGDCAICEVFELHDDDWAIAEQDLPIILMNMKNSINKNEYRGYTEHGKSVIKLARRKSSLAATR